MPEFMCKGKACVAVTFAGSRIHRLSDDDFVFFWQGRRFLRYLVVPNNYKYKFWVNFTEFEFYYIYNVDGRREGDIEFSPISLRIFCHFPFI